eukprot:750771-Hanusia_phi.AAC.1
MGFSEVSLVYCEIGESRGGRWRGQQRRRRSRMGSGWWGAGGMIVLQVEGRSNFAQIACAGWMNLSACFMPAAPLTLTFQVMEIVACYLRYARFACLKLLDSA